jgi:ketosteroid isomerase-like protein
MDERNQRRTSMTNEEIKGVIRGFLQASSSGDSSKALSFMTDDANVTAWGTVFRGKSEVRRYLDWMMSRSAETKITETGVGIVTSGNTGIVEHVISGVVEGKRYDVPAVCIYELRDNKIREVRGFSDRLHMAQQAAGGVSLWKGGCRNLLFLLVDQPRSRAIHFVIYARRNRYVNGEQ